MDQIYNSDPTIGVDPVSVAPTISVVQLRKKVMIALPWGKMTHPITAISVAQLMMRRKATTMLNFGDAFVAHSRNAIADEFLKTDCEYLLMIDDDMVIPFGDGPWYRVHTGWNLPDQFANLNALDRLLGAEKTLVGALYFGRYPKANPVYGEGPREREQILKTTPRNEVKPTRWVGTGCILIARQVFEDIERTFPRLRRGADRKGGQWFTSSEHNAMEAIDAVRKFLSEGAMTGEKAMKAYQMLESASTDARVTSTLGMGEDVQFCLRAKQAGHQPYVDCGLLVGHIGHAVYPLK